MVASQSKAAASRINPISVAAFIIRQFSTVHAKRPAPSANKTKHVRLIAITPSHFCEKARWVLDMLEQDEASPYYFTEDAHPPAFHADFTLKASKGEATVTPMVVEDDNTVVWGSDVVLNKFYPSLYPKDIEQEIKDVEDDFGVRLGEPLRCFCYHHLLYPSYYSSLSKLCAAEDKVSIVEAKLFPAMLPKGLADGMRTVLGINQESAEESEASLRQVFQEVSKQLEEGREYLMDAPGKPSYGFTAADLTFAALAYPLVCPPEMKKWTLDDDELAPKIKELKDHLRSTKAGEFVLKIYQKHRPVGEVGEAIFHRAERDKYPWQFWL